MELVDFNPLPPAESGSVIESMVHAHIDNKDRNALTQSAGSIHSDWCQGANGYFSIMRTLLPQLVPDIDMREGAVRSFCAGVVPYIGKDFDLVYTRRVEKKRTVTVEVPKVRKAGLFKKEEYVEYEERTESYFEQEQVIYKGWRIERLHRREGAFDGYGEDLFLDYCLGADGKLYLIASTLNGYNDSLQVVLECTFFAPVFMSSAFCNVYFTAVGGAIGALDAIPIDPNDPRRSVRIDLDDEYHYNFPVQLEDPSSSPYGFLEGTIKRVANLLTDEEKAARGFAHEELKTWLYM